MKTAIFNAKGPVTEILVYDQIGMDPWFGGGIDAKEFREQVKAVKTPTINLRINSPGGSVLEGAAMMAALDEFKGTIDVDIDGLVASAASVLAMAGDTIRMASNSLLMIHNPMGGVMGGAEDMRRYADLLDKVKGQIIDAYLRRSSLSRDELAAAMDAETWYTGAEAVDAGLADETTAPISLAAFAGLDRMAAKFGYKHAPTIAAEEAAWEETRRRQAVLAALIG